MLLEHFVQLWLMFIPLYLSHVYLAARGKGRILGVVIGFMFVILGLQAWLEPFEYINGYEETSTASGKLVTNITSISDLDTLTLGDMSARSILAVMTVIFGIYTMLSSLLAIMSSRRPTLRRR